MSSIDKYVADEARLSDSRVRVTNNNGRITGKINGKTVFVISDRYGLLSNDERRKIHEEIRAYREREEEERRRKEEEERRRKEEERQKELLNLEKEIEERLNIIDTNIKSLDNVYNEKIDSINNLNNNVNEIKSILPTVNIEELNVKNNNLHENLKNKYSTEYQRLKNIERSIQDVQKKFNKNSPITDLLNIKKEIKKINLNFENFDLGTEIEMTKKEIDNSRQNALKLANIIKESNIIIDDRIKNQIYQEINNLNITDDGKIRQALRSIENIIYKYKSNLGREKINQQIEEFNKLEALIRSTKELIEYNVNDTYSLSNINEENRTLVEKAMDKLQKLKEIPYKVTDMNISEIESQLYKIMINPSNLDSENKWLKDLINNLDCELNRAPSYKNQYDEFIKLKEELMEFGEIYEDEFDCKNGLDQIHNLESKIIAQMEEAELGNLYDTYFKIIESMENTNYEVFKTDNDQYSIEVYFINKKYPGVLTRFIINNNGSFRRSLVGLKIDECVTKDNQILEISRKMEDDVDQFLTSYEKLTGKEPQIEESVLYDDTNSGLKIHENGYFELNEAEKESYNQFMEIENIVANAENDITRFGFWDENIHRIKDTRIERDAIRTNSESYQRKNR